MPVIIAESPYDQVARIHPLPVENCFEFCFSFFDVLQESGTQALFGVTLPNSTPNVVGEKFVIAGVEFEVGLNDSSDDTSGGYLVNWVYASGGQNGSALLGAIIKHPKFKNKVTGTLALVGTLWQVTILWNCPGEVPDWEFDFTQLTNPPTFSEINGTNNEYTEGFKVGYNLQYYAEDKEIIPLQQIPALYDCFGNVTGFCINISKDISRIVNTFLPDCSTPLQIDPEIQKKISLFYGSLEANLEDGCGIRYYDWKETNSFKVINSAWNTDFGEFGLYFFNEGWYQYSLGVFDTPGEVLVKFLTLIPPVRTRCEDVCDWLWIVANLQEVYAFVNPVYRARYQFFDSSGTLINTTNLDVLDALDTVYVLPSGPKNVLENVLSDPLLIPAVCYFKIQLFAIMDIAPFNFPYSEEITVKISKGCCNSTGIYFLDPLGGYSYMPMDYIQEETYTSSFTEICKDTKCANTYKDKLQGNKFNRRSELKSELTLRSREWQKNEVNRLIFKAFKGSEYHFMLKDGLPKHVLLSSGDTRIYQHREYLELFTTVVDAGEWLNQSDK